MIILAIAIIAGVAFFFVKKSLFPSAAQEEYISYDKDRQIKLIDEQLKGLDIEKIRAKAHLIMEKSIAEIKASIAEGKLSYEELTAFYLDRIKTYDTGNKGLNAVTEINPNAINDARAKDKAPDNGNNISGIPVLIKDNINTNNMPTSGGTVALSNFTPKTNADLVNELINAGAIILGKANLSELANYMDAKMPGGYSSKTGQTHNPFDPINLSPQGSSSGSGAAVAANFSAVALGTETTGSITAPAAVSSIVGYKPTKDLISTKGVIPLAASMDTVGPMTKNVTDAAVLFNASISDKTKQLSLAFEREFIKGKTIGVYDTGSAAELIKRLKELGANVVTVTLDEKGIENDTIIEQEFKYNLGEYLSANEAPVKSLAELIEFNKKDLGRNAKYGQGLLEDANDTEKPDTAKVAEIVKNAKSKIDKLFEDNKLDALVFIDTDGIVLPSVAGYPVITVPLGAPGGGSPMGATFVAKANEDQKLINIAYSFEAQTNLRAIPQKYLNQQ